MQNDDQTRQENDQVVTNTRETTTTSFDDPPKGNGREDGVAAWRGDGGGASRASRLGDDDASAATLGECLELVSNTVNENLVLFRYGTFSTVALLGAYGMLNTPLFRRFKRVREIPEHYFARRRTLHCRLVDVARSSSSSSSSSLVFRVRHLSPVGRLSATVAGPLHDAFHERLSPSSRNEGDLLPVEIAGISTFPSSSRSKSIDGGDDAWLRTLVEHKTRVRCRLLAVRRTPDDGEEGEKDDERREVIVAKLTYRPGWRNDHGGAVSGLVPTLLFGTDLATSLATHGRAPLSATMSSSTTGDGDEAADRHPLLASSAGVAHASSSLAHLREDAAYVETLGRAETWAATERRGRWSDPSIREAPAFREFVRQIEADVARENLPWWRKGWSWLKHRLSDSS